jgi:hypothetical protein
MKSREALKSKALHVGTEAVRQVVLPGRLPVVGGQNERRQDNVLEAWVYLSTLLPLGWSTEIGPRNVGLSWGLGKNEALLVGANNLPVRLDTLLATVGGQLGEAVGTPSGMACCRQCYFRLVNDRLDKLPRGPNVVYQVDGLARADPLN